jgi:trans-2,3-dihydro-3-hydroxyanthranilate isomerase
MEERIAALVDAYADTPTEGVPIGVVTDAGDLDGEQQRAAADELGAAATAFVTGDADSIACWATGARRDGDVDALVGALAYCHEHQGIDGDDDADAGDDTEGATLTDGTVHLNRPRPTFDPVEVDHETVGECLGVDPAALTDVGDDLPLAVGGDGEQALLVPVNFFDRFTEVTLGDTGQLPAERVIAFTLDAASPAADLHVRPLGMDPPTVGHAGVLAAAYLRWAGAYDELPSSIGVECGHAADRPGLFQVRFDEDDDAGNTTDVAGPVLVASATTAMEGTLRVPPIDGDIIEV